MLWCDVAHPLGNPGKTVHAQDMVGPGGAVGSSLVGLFAGSLYSRSFPVVNKVSASPVSPTCSRATSNQSNKALMPSRLDKSQNKPCSLEYSQFMCINSHRSGPDKAHAGSGTRDRIGPLPSCSWAVKPNVGHCCGFWACPIIVHNQNQHRLLQCGWVLSETGKGVTGCGSLGGLVQPTLTSPGCPCHGCNRKPQGPANPAGDLSPPCSCGRSQETLHCYPSSRSKPP